MKYGIDRSLTNKPVTKGSGVNTLYLTNQCNLACTYCYEDLGNKEKETLSINQLKKNIDIILERENPDEQTLFILFGGEPTLEFNKCLVAVDYALSKKQNCTFNMISNGIKFLQDDFCTNFKSLRNTTLDISFDGSGNQERIYHSGKESTNDMYKVFAQLKKFNIPWRLRYTINSSNVNTIVEDLINIYVRYKPARMITSVAWDTLNSALDFKTIDTAQIQLRHLWTNNQLTSPVCDIFCDMCDGCESTKEFKAYYNQDGEVRIDNNEKNVGSFNDFKTKEK